MELSVGRVVLGHSQINEATFTILTKMASVILSGKMVNGLDYEVIRDSRLSCNDWIPVLHKELLNLFTWITKRIIYHQKSNVLREFDYAFCFQPYYGITLHYLRRAIPLAILGINIKVVFSDDVYSKAITIIEELNKLLDISNCSVLTRKEFEHQNIERSTLFVVTGKQETFDHLNGRFSEICCIGAIGTGALMVVDTENYIQDDFKLVAMEPSCTNVVHTVFLRNEVLYDVNGNNLPNCYIKDLNPTVIYTTADIPKHLVNDGYKCIDLNNKENTTGVGLCADPLHGYPGDYLY